ncbi:hypothetical protein BDV23DRAFT_185182 [Aspergillus alliaceus]|uniref:Uncharacterized protein n=1 Tax=Petromyces alliaceus TaxID=209559 RepID=A0A5N7C4T4_PETAA|nr:hypothetical protein BDV23DRAFT_185182 [Aspergillus alliaceus]
MPMSWTPEANAHLLLGIVDELKDANFKLNYRALAAHMGPEVTACAVENQISKLRKKFDGSTSASATPASTPTKRKRTVQPKTPTKKGASKAKAAVDDGDETVSEEETPAKKVVVKEEGAKVLGVKTEEDE